MSGEEVQGTVSQSEPTEAPAEAAPETAPEKPAFETPDWVYEQEPEPKPEVKPEPAKPAANAPRWEPPAFDPDLLARDGDKYMRWYLGGWTGPLAQREVEHQREIAELRSRASEPTIHPAIVSQQMRRAQEGLSKALQRFSGDETFSNPGLRKRVEDYAKGFMKESRTLARKGDFSGIEAMADEDFWDTTFEYFKRKAGFRGGKPPVSVASPEAALETPKGHAVAGEVKFTKDDEEAYKYAHEKRGISRADFAKLIAADKAERGED